MDDVADTVDRPSVSSTDPDAGSRSPAAAGQLVAAVHDRAEAPWRLSYNPALDGIRGLSVGVVLLFHAGYPWARGGYLGVSTFFTLSGFLITSLLLGERRAEGRISLGRFWARRMRRLLPASALTLVAVAVVSQVDPDLRTPGLAGDLVASSLQVANWRFLFDDQAYADLFGSPSPVLHFWSLAIEEQFYWVFPVLTVAVFAVARGSVRVYAAALAALLTVSFVATVSLGPDEATAVYYATYTRMGEILVGSLLAVAMSLGLAGLRGMRAIGLAGGALALVAIVWCWSTVDQTSAAIYEGGLLGYALLSGVLVLAACVPGPVRRLLAFAPLRWLGLVSYGVYLAHWPIFLVLDGRRTGLDQTPLFVLRVVVTLAVAVASYVLIELPIRRGWTPPRVPMPALAGATVVAVTLIGLVVPAEPDGAADPTVALLSEGEPLPEPTDVPSEALVGVSLGDSAMLLMGRGLLAWGAESGELVLAPTTITGSLGCPVSRGGEVRFHGGEGFLPTGCDTWGERLAPEVERVRRTNGRLDLVVIHTGLWEVTDRRLPGDDQWRSPGDPTYDAFLYDEFSEVTDRFVDQGLVVVWILSPVVDVGRNEVPPPAEPYPESDPDRMARLNEIIERVADERDSAVVVDLPDYLRERPGGEMDDRLRPDGVHFDPQASYEVAGEWLGGAIVDAYRSEPNPLAPPPAAPVPDASAPTLPEWTPTPAAGSSAGSSTGSSAQRDRGG